MLLNKQALYIIKLNLSICLLTNNYLDVTLPMLLYDDKKCVEHNHWSSYKVCKKIIFKNYLIVRKIHDCQSIVSSFPLSMGRTHSKFVNLGQIVLTLPCLKDPSAEIQ